MAVDLNRCIELQDNASYLAWAVISLVSNA
jgi:hypothetical protein